MGYYSPKMQERITLDYDNKNLLRLGWRLFCITWSLEFNGLVVKQTKRGYHVIIWLSKPVSNKEHFELRFRYGDDLNRIKLDKQRLRRKEPIQILFCKNLKMYYKKVKK